MVYDGGSPPPTVIGPRASHALRPAVLLFVLHAEEDSGPLMGPRLGDSYWPRVQFDAISNLPLFPFTKSQLSLSDGIFETKYKIIHVLQICRAEFQVIKFWN